MNCLNQDSIRVIAPSIYHDTSWNEAEVLGAMVWLWNRNSNYRNVAISSALETLLPTIQSRNFILLIKNNRPLGYLNWAYLNKDEEREYLNKTKSYVSFVQCNKRDESKQLWLLSFFCPFGRNESFLLKSICKKVLKNNLCFYGYHKSKTNTVVKKVQC
ncbi:MULTISPECIES: toxin-activating lysine-acyltransferase [unclassified Gilliamella]|uniref:toxin-activating lysine-acyltransferase n=1 Tax=unclassified Gilliamella TaxID=2685620 RepID=UPI00226A880E|nr:MULTISPECIES: toxin-activating lysine-acyltransferase [unclassified Gilliamella]MCX8597686.1 toxin-activating lysine-acyltransferase [Gilliamella sp. B3493]MCX8599142.1 toxin-activating lysine-acyltransferase [Gilliamella sp. B3486]MCX8689428.1 toxin-activating lysine-acyltransferase [Gilliamella sp. B2973]MCX8705129.1 toxin-activating lysine-acyltransferase [Gilliamella sp. B3127]